MVSRKAGPSWLLGRRIPMRADLFLRSHTMVYTYCLLLLLAHRPDGSYYALWCLPRAPFCCLFAPSFAHVRSQRGDIVVFPEYRNKHPVMWRPASHGFNKLTTQPNRMVLVDFQREAPIFSDILEIPGSSTSIFSGVPPLWRMCALNVPISSSHFEASLI